MKTRIVTTQQLVRQYFPGASRREVEMILWEKTGFPAFWRGDPMTCLRRQLSQYKRALRMRCDVCYCCGKIRTRAQMTKWGDFCLIGERALKEMSDAGSGASQSLSGNAGER